jgi:CheY-like chemotaxis protein
VLLDHMMPGMDGIETAKAIRDWETEQKTLGNNSVEFAKQTPKLLEHPSGVPIIALTANAVSGMKELFLQHGFSDYLSKPIEIPKLDGIMAKWIPVEKRIKTGIEIKREAFSGETGIVIPGVDVKKGIIMTGGSVEGYKLVLSQFYRDAEERLPYFNADSSSEVVAIHAHASKSAAATIGAANVSAEAARLESLSLAAAKVSLAKAKDSGKTGDRTIIAEALPACVKQLAELVEAIMALDVKVNGEKADAGAEFAASLPLLRELEAALREQKAVAIDRLIDELRGKITDSKTREALDQISDYVLLPEYEKALEIFNDLLDVLKKGEIAS